MIQRTPPARHAIAFLVAMTCALFLRAWLQIRLRDNGFPDAHAADLSWLVVPPTLLVLLWPVLWRDRRFLAGLFETRHLDRRVILDAIAIGVLIRIAWWSQLIAGGAFGFYRGDGIPSGPRFMFDCPAPAVFTLGVMVMAVGVPVVEEVAFRGYLQTVLRRYGAIVAIVTSTAVFTLFHPPGDALFVVLAGIVFGIQYHRHDTLWPSMITHATINGLIQVDWRCLKGQWNPPESQLPLWGPGVVGAMTFCASVILISFLLLRRKDRSARALRSQPS